MTKIINLLGSSGSGKSTTAAGLFNLMKLRKYSVELVHEYAKVLTWEERYSALKNQSLIFGKQSFALDRLLGRVDYIITDSPLILSLVYTRPEYPASFKTFALEMFQLYNNINFFIKRVKPFIKLGRNESEEQSNNIAVDLHKILSQSNIPYTVIDGDENAPQNILSVIETTL